MWLYSKIVLRKASWVISENNCLLLPFFVSFYLCEVWNTISMVFFFFFFFLRLTGSGDNNENVLDRRCNGGQTKTGPTGELAPCPGVCSNSCPLSQWCHPTISSSVVPLSPCPQSFPASGSFQMSQLFASGGQRIGISASASVLQMNTQDWSPLGWTGWISCSPRDSQEFALSFLYSPTLTSIHDYWKKHSLD